MSPMTHNWRRSPVAAFVRLRLLVVTCGLVWAASGQESVPQQYAVDVWQVEQGLPDMSVTSMAQTPDGYLWVSTFNGLARFDGVRFEIFDKRTPGLESDGVVRLWVDRAGALWAYMADGQVARYASGRFTTFHERDGWAAQPCGGRGMSLDPSGAMVFLTASGLLFRFEGTRFVKLSVEAAPHRNFGPALDKEAGAVWTTRDGVAGLVHDNQWTEFRSHGELLTNVLALSPSQEGGVWVYQPPSLLRVREAAGVVETIRYPLGREPVWVYEDSHGQLWVGTWGSGVLLLARDGSYQRYTLKEGFPSDVPREFFEDREHNVWIATNEGGLARLKRKIFFTYRRLTDFPPPHAVPMTMAEDPDGRLWIGLLDLGVCQLQHGRISEPAEPAGRFTAPGVWAALAGRGGPIWFGTYGKGIARLHGEDIAWWTVRDGLVHPHVLALYEDHEGVLWAGTDGGLSRFDGRSFSNYTTREGLLADSVRALAQDNSGALWIGTAGGLNRLLDGRLTAITNGLPGTSVRSLRADADGSLWIGTAHGLRLLRNGRMTLMDLGEVLSNAEIAVILDDELGYLWLGSNRGVFRVARAELEAFVRGERAHVECAGYDQSDGLGSAQCSAGQPAGLRTRDGRLWFATANGLSVVHPRALSRNTNPPPVVIQEVRIDGSSVLKNPDARGASLMDNSSISGDAQVKVPPGPRRLEIRYAGLSLMAPERVKFKYRLDGVDEVWRDVGGQRSASYQGLPAGNYKFHVIAANNDGVWNDEGATLAFVVQPQLWEAAWFRASVLTALGGMIFLAVRRRIQRLQRQHAAQREFSRGLIESQEQERKRIAAELHDSLGQNLLVIKNRAAMAKNPGAPASQELEEISRLAAQSLEEVREISQNLRPYQLDRLGLTRALHGLVKKVGASAGLHCVADLTPLDRVFSPEAEVNLFRMVQEALNNVLKHSGASEARVTVERDETLVRLVIEDNGRGFDWPPKPNDAAHGMGLSGIAERARILDGRLEIVSAPGKGTRLKIEVPLPKEKV